MKEGISQTRLYSIWVGMKQRCYNPKSTHYKAYGGRGITICDEWKNNFYAFSEWALSHGYQDPPIGEEKNLRNNLTIDRIDDDKGYSPKNCQWITLSKNNMKKRANSLYGSAACREFAEWLKDECIKTSRSNFLNDSELHGAWKLRDFISYAIDQQCGIKKINALKEKDIPKARAFAEKVLALFEEAIA